MLPLKDDGGKGRQSRIMDTSLLRQKKYVLKQVKGALSKCAQ